MHAIYSQSQNKTYTKIAEEIDLKKVQLSEVRKFRSPMTLTYQIRSKLGKKFVDIRTHLSSGAENFNLDISGILRTANLLELINV